MYKVFLESVLRSAAVIARLNFGKVSGSTKESDNNQVLTKTDIEIGNHIVRRIKEKYPGHNIIDEEAGVIDNGSRYTWVVDPIDGTSNFAAGVPLYGVMIGLLEKGMPVAGGIALPEQRGVYTAEKDKGARCNGRPIHVTGETDLRNCLVVYGIDGHQEAPDKTYEEMKTLAEVVLGSRNLRTSNSAFDLMMVARGAYGACLNRTCKIWDVVAPAIIVQEAGGKCSDFFGQPLDFSQPLAKADTNFTNCSAAPVLHRQLQELIISDKS